MALTKEVLELASKEMPIFGKGTHLMSEKDMPQSQLGANIGSRNVVEFAKNEYFQPILSNVIQAYSDNDQAFIADIVAPFFEVPALSGTWRKMADRTFYDQPNTAAGKMTRPNFIDHQSDLINYDLSGRALAAYISRVDMDDSINQYGSADRLRQIVATQLAKLLLLDREITVANLYQTVGTYAAGFTAVAAPLWSAAAATPMGDVITGEDKLYSPRDLVILGHNVYRTLQTSPAVTGSTLVSGATRNQLKPYANQEAIENYFDSKIAVGSARYNSTPGTDTMTMTYIWRDYAIAAHLADDPGLPEISSPFVRTFKLKSKSFPNVEGWTVKTVQDEGTMAGGEILMVGYWSQEKVYAQKAGYLIQAL